MSSSTPRDDDTLWRSSSPLACERRRQLAAKGQRLYQRGCGTDLSYHCAEQFAMYHIQRGETVVAQDLLAYLETMIEQLQTDDPLDRLDATRELVGRIREQLQRKMSQFEENSVGWEEIHRDTQVN